MSRPEYLRCPMTPEIIRRIREEQEYYERYEREERRKQEERELEQQREREVTADYLLALENAMTPTEPSSGKAANVRTAMRWLSTEEKAALTALLADYERMDELLAECSEELRENIEFEGRLSSFQSLADRIDALRATLKGERG